VTKLENCTLRDELSDDFAILEKKPLQIEFQGELDHEDVQVAVATATPTETKLGNINLKQTLRSVTCLADG
jgi:hypothetical protein